MSDEETELAASRDPLTKEERVILVRSLLVDWKVLEHLQQQGAIQNIPALRAQCCKPDGGTCCVNKG